MGSASSIHSLLPLLIHLLLPPIPFSSPSPEPLSQAALHFLDDAKSPELLGWMVGIRRRLHQHPELGYEKHEISKLVRSELDLLGIPHNHPVAVTGVVGFVGTGKAPFVVLTADMDALAFQDVEWDHKSRVAGKMHACGHDAHVAMLLGAARILQQHREKLSVVNVAKFQAGGGSFNVIPDAILIGGTFRAFSKQSLMQLMKQRVGQAAVQRCTAEVDFLLEEKPISPVTVNSNELHEFFERVVEDLLGPDSVKVIQPMMGSEDFASFSDMVPGYYFFLGMKNESQQELAPLHSSNFAVNEAALPHGAALHAALAARYLSEFRGAKLSTHTMIHDEL